MNKKMLALLLIFLLVIAIYPTNALAETHSFHLEGPGFSLTFYDDALAHGAIGRGYTNAYIPPFTNPGSVTIWLRFPSGIYNDFYYSGIAGDNNTAEQKNWGGEFSYEMLDSAQGPQTIEWTIWSTQGDLSITEEGSFTINVIHDLVRDPARDVEATHEHEGREAYTCVVCGVAEDIILPPIEDPTDLIFGGILQPINQDGTSVFKVGRTIPVKFQLTDDSGNFIPDAVATIGLTKLSNGVAEGDLEAVSTSAATTGNLFRYDQTSNQYIFNLGTKGLSGGTYRLTITLDGGQTHEVNFGLK